MATGDVSAHRLAIDAQLTANGRNLQALPVKFQDHHELPKSTTLLLPPAKRRSTGGDSRRLTSRGRSAATAKLGKFEVHNWGGFSARSQGFLRDGVMRNYFASS
jgi:hypothetical protein